VEDDVVAGLHVRDRRADLVDDAPAATTRTFTSVASGARTSTPSRIAACSPSYTSAFITELPEI
jgi:hypothetical protein